MMAHWQLPLVCFVSMAVLACGGSDGSSVTPGPDGASGDPEARDARPGSNVAGGTTSDFTGDPTTCTPERIEPGEGPQLSMAELLASDTGDFRVPIRWESVCSEPTRAGIAGCDDAGAGFHALHGVETTVIISMLYDGSPATVTYATEAEPGCAPTRAMPYMLRLRSLDGVLDETVSAVTEGCSTSTGLGFNRPVRDLIGSLGSEAMGFADDFEVQVTAGFFDDRMWFDLHVTPTEQSHLWVFTIDLPPFGVQTHDVPTSIVLPSAPLAPGHCGPSPAP